MTIVITLRGFNDLGRSVTPIFLSMGLDGFSTFCEKMKKICRVEVLIFCKTLLHLTSSFSCEAVSNASLRVKVCESDGNI